MVARKPGRYLAPVALIAVVLAVVLLVRARVDVNHAAAHDVVHQLPVSRDLVAKRAFYVIKAGDSLSTISVRTGVPIATLESLNPSLTQDPTALQTGQRLRLR